jgi:hypothetical protein
MSVQSVCRHRMTLDKDTLAAESPSAALERYVRRAHWCLRPHREYGALSEVSSVSRKLADVVRMVITPIRTTARFSSKPYATLPTRSGDEGVHEGANENLVDETADKGGGDQGVNEGVDTSIEEGVHGGLDEGIWTDSLMSSASYRLSIVM